MLLIFYIYRLYGVNLNENEDIKEEIDNNYKEYNC